MLKSLDIEELVTSNGLGQMSIVPKLKKVGELSLDPDIFTDAQMLAIKANLQNLVKREIANTVHSPL